MRLLRAPRVDGPPPAKPTGRPPQGIPYAMLPVHSLILAPLRAGRFLCLKRPVRCMRTICVHRRHHPAQTQNRAARQFVRVFMMLIGPRPHTTCGTQFEECSLTDRAGSAAVQRGGTLVCTAATTIPALSTWYRNGRAMNVVTGQRRRARRIPSAAGLDRLCRMRARGRSNASKGNGQPC